MGKYRKIDTRIWNDAKFRLLSKDAKWAFFYVLTHPNMTSLGAMRATVQGLAAELGIPPKAFQEASRKGLLEIDEDASYVGATNFLKYNGPESPNVVKSWAHSLDLVPECELKVQLTKRVVSHVGGLHKGFAEALPKAFRLPLPIPEQEQEQEQETSVDLKADRGQCLSAGITNFDGQVFKDDILAVFSHYRTHHPRAAPNPTRHSKEWKLIRDRLVEGFDVDTLRTAIDGCHKTPHNNGDNDRNQKYQGLALIMRDASQVQRFCENNSNGAAGSNAAPSKDYATHTPP